MNIFTRSGAGALGRVILYGMIRGRILPKGLGKGRRAVVK